MRIFPEMHHKATSYYHMVVAQQTTSLVKPWLDDILWL
jgi:hypothetical protein